MKVAALRVPAFRRLTTAWTFSNFGDSTLYLTLAIWTKDLTGSDASAGLVFLFLGLPAFLAPLAGHLADRLPRRRLVIAANVAAASAVLTLAFVDSPGDVWLIYVVTFGYGLLTYVTSACGSGLVRDLLADDDLAGANGLLQTIDQGLRLLSPLVGAGMYAAFGGTAIAVFTAAMLVVAAAIVATVRMTESGPTPHAERGTFWIEVTAGMRHIRRTHGLARVTVLFSIAFGITGLANVAIFAAIEQGLERGSEFFGVFASVQGAGSIAGGVTAAIVIKRWGERPAMATGLALLATGIAALVTENLPAMIVGAFAAGVGIPWGVVGYVTMRQRLTPPQLQGRVSAAANLAFNGPQTFGTALGAALIGIVDYRVMTGVMVAVIAACAAGVAARGSRAEVLPGAESGDGVGDHDIAAVGPRLGANEGAARSADP